MLVINCFYSEAFRSLLGVWFSSDDKLQPVVYSFQCNWIHFHFNDIDYFYTLLHLFVIHMTSKCAHLSNTTRNSKLCLKLYSMFKIWSTWYMLSARYCSYYMELSNFLLLFDVRFLRFSFVFCFYNYQYKKWCTNIII